MDLYSGLHPYSRLGAMEALEGARILERKLEVTSNNLANANTTGFKSAKVTFHEYLLKEQDGTNRTAKGERGWADFSAGSLRKSDNPYDMAIDGPGFFVVQGPDGPLYTRAGNFTLNDNYQLVTKEGYPVLGDGAPITLEDTTGSGVWLSEDGHFFVDETIASKIDVVSFDNPQALKRMGSNYFQATQGAGPPAPTDSPVKQGYVEMSNVNGVMEMVHLIDLNRGYEAQQKSLQAIDQLDDKAVNNLGKVG